MYTEKVESFFLFYFVLFSIISSVFCYLNVDPMKSCLYLVLSLILISPFISFGFQIWYSYFVCLLFLSGIFVILVYFSSLSKYNFYYFSMSIFIFLGFLFFPFIYFKNFNNFMFELFLFEYFFLILFLVFNLLLFMNFSSYFLNFSGALRKI